MAMEEQPNVQVVRLEPPKPPLLPDNRLVNLRPGLLARMRKRRIDNNIVRQLHNESGPFLAGVQKNKGCKQVGFQEDLYVFINRV
jgi:hypothetical protein